MDPPAALPQIAVCIRITVALALQVSVSAETLLSTDGIGTIIVRSREQFRIAQGLAALVLIALTALVINGVVARPAAPAGGDIWGARLPRLQSPELSTKLRPDGRAQSALST